MTHSKRQRLQRLCSLLAVLVLLSTSSSQAAALPHGTSRGHQLSIPADTGQLLTSWLDEALEQYQVPGAAMALVEKDRIQLAGGGMSSLASEQAVDVRSTAFNAPALGRLIVAIASLQLQTQGKMDLLAPLANLPSDIRLPQTRVPLTMAHLLTQASGLTPQTIGTALAGEVPVPPPAEVLGRMPQPAVIYPETSLSASSYNIALAATLVEQAAGVPYADYVEANILHPLGMYDSSISQPLPRHVAGQAAAGYTAGKPCSPRTYLLPAADGLYVSAADGAALVQALLNGGAAGTGRILPPDAIPFLFQPQFSLDERLPGVTFSFDELWLADDRLLELASSANGFTGALLIWPDGQLGALLLYNSDTPALYRAFREQFCELLGIGLVHQELAASRFAPEYADQLRGFYQRVPAPAAGPERTRLLFRPDTPAELWLRVSADGLLSVSPGAATSWTQLEPGLLVDKELRVRLLVQPSPDGQVTQITLNQVSYERVPWYWSFYWQRRLGICLIILLLLGLIPLIVVLFLHKRPAGMFTAPLGMAAISLLLISAALGWYVVYTSELQFGLPAVSAWLGYVVIAAGVLAVIELVWLVADLVRRHNLPAWLYWSSAWHILAAALSVWYAYYWYLV